MTKAKKTKAPAKKAPATKAPEKAPEKKAKKAAPGKWLPISQFMAEDYDEDLKAYTGAHTRVELQQNSKTKVIRTVKVDE